jgi:ribosomal protein S18 acetylase RimI-like enzyme
MPGSSSSAASVALHDVRDAPPAWVADFLERNHSTRIASRGRLHYPAQLPGFVATRADEPFALATYRIEGRECEVVTLHSEIENVGAGTALLARVADAARKAGCRRLWLITTNDNTRAIRFYQRRGLSIAGVRAGAAVVARRTLKPEIPQTGNDGIPIRDEIEFELLL